MCVQCCNNYKLINTEIPIFTMTEKQKQNICKGLFV